MMPRGHSKHRPPERRLARQDSRTLSIHRNPSQENLNIPEHVLKEFGSKGVQESDGNFFESFTALAWKQENRRLRAASEDEKQRDRPPPSESLLGPRPKLHHLHRKEFELLYIEVLYTIKHKIGTTSGGHLPFIQDLYLYAREAFGVTPEDHARLLAKASEEKPPIVSLNVKVVEARGLEAKDADGFSDPYCMLGIMPGSRLGRERTDSSGVSSDEDSRTKKEDRKSALKKFSQSFKRKKEKTARDLIPAKFIQTSSVQLNTLNPVWNEKFRFDLEEVNTDRLHLDIWDHDEEFSVVDAAKRLNEVQGLKGLGRFFKQVAQSARTSSKGNVDDFLGCVDLRLDNIPSTGSDKWHDLDGRSSRSNVEGQIRLKMTLATREDRGIPEEDNWTDIRQHEDLMGIFIAHEIRKSNDEVFKWRGALPQAALTILHQHAIQGDITEIQEVMCRWAAYSRKHREQPFDWEFLLQLLSTLDDMWEPASLSRDEEESLAESFQLFIEFCLGLIHKEREVYPPANKAAYRRLTFMLSCLAKIYEMKVFRRCCPFQKELHHEIIAVLKKSSTEWYERMHTATRAQGNSEEDTLASLIELTNILNTDMQKASQYYRPVYEGIVNVRYFDVIYKQLEKLLADDIHKGLEDEIEEDFSEVMDRVRPNQVRKDVGESEAGSVTAQQMGMQLFELYLALQEFCRFKEQLASGERRSLSITLYYEWFKSPVQRWLNIAKHKAMRRIKKAVELDKVDKVKGEKGDVKQSTSAVDVCCCFGQVIEFWKHLEWPDAPGSWPYVAKITEDLCEGATLYADLIHEKLRRAGYYDEVGMFDVTEQLCITINDIEQVRRALKPIPSALQYEEVIRAIEKMQGEKAARDGRIRLGSILRCADEDMVRKIRQVVDRVADKMRPGIKKDVFHLCWSPDSVPAEDAISDLMNYLDSNLVTLHSNLLRTNFDRILLSIWVEVMEEMKEVVLSDESISKMPAFYERLYESLDILVDFFHANEKGLSMSTIRSPQYDELFRLLSLNKASTRELIETYYLEKLEEQEKTASHEYGVLSVRVYYNTEAEILSVEVLNAKNIIPLDANGLSDPFVLIELCAHHVFSNQTVQQTKIVKNTLNPVFDESFDFSVSVEQCQAEGACILFTVMDHDFMLTNDFAGEAYLSLNTIPGISGEEVSGFSALTPVNMPLTQPQKVRDRKAYETKAKGALAAMETRDWDKDAQEFVKKRRQVEQQSVNKT